eukprot:CAMPEP_0172328386 /NCGR_PEP_ID=MMETSP1058-20130122/60324_1 /TAXON_ID=83371 /ORGANISM="Detonula confervacea, Strain CCMP 353" /LENGTH=1901 /DNA_ID=CAMNT_0013045499 /DNA_START=59 /DNA_END=5764 /DNA_ORIENTATION=+
MSSSEAAPANIRVLVRIRPFNDREAKFNPTSALEVDNGGMTSTIDFGMGDSTTTPATNSSASSKGTISIVDQTAGAGGYGSGYDSGATNATLAAATSTAARSFTYDAVFGPQSQQQDVFGSVKGIVDAVCAGYNGTIVAYGQTGSGKTHTIFGEEGLQDNNNAGLVQRSLKSIFHKIADQSLISPTSAAAAASDGTGASIRTTTKASFFEIYNERVYDLLSPNDNIVDDDKGLAVREDATKGVYVEGLVEREVSNTMDAMNVLHCGTKNRSVAATNMNRVSSRSHAMFVLTVKSVFSESGISKVRISKFTMVDLAGSERQKATATDGDRLKEASMINNSLLCLGQVINSLVDREKGKLKHVPFRDSKLTFLLRDSWGGNSKTCLVATVTPSFASLSETMSTLKFAQRAKMIKNTAVLNENTCGSVAALQTEIARLRAELELKNDSTLANDGGQQTAGSGLPPLDPKSNADEKEPATGVTVLALRNQNSKLNKKVKVLKDSSNHREMQVNSLKRKLQQETLVRKCKERRITYLSGRGKTSGPENDDDEIATLTQEITILREQLEAQPSESVEWMLKYKEEKAKVEEMDADATTTFEADEKNELESSLVTLLDERDSLQQKVDDMSNERNTEIDSIIKDVTNLENANIMLQSQMDKKDLVIMANEDNIQSNEAHIEELQEEMKTALDCLESTQGELAAESRKAIELQESLDSIKIEATKANATVVEHQGKVSIAEEELKQMTEQHNTSAIALNTKIAELQKDVTTAMDDNASLIEKLKEASDNLEAKQTQLEGIDREKSEALKQLGLSEEKNSTDLESSKRQEEALRAEIKKAEESVESLLAEKADATASLEKATTQNASLSGEVDALKLERDELQQRVESLDKLHDDVASLEDEVAFMIIEKEQVEERLQLTEADLERTIRLQEHLNDTQIGAHDAELTGCEEIINNLSMEKSKVQDELTKISQQLTENTAASEETVAMLQNDLSEHQDQYNSLEAGMKDAQEAVENLLSEKTQTAASLEKVTAQCVTLSEDVQALKSERDALQLTLNTKLSELQKDLDVALGDNESLTKKLKEASDDLEAKKTQLESLDRDKLEALTQLGLSEEKNSTDLESSKRQEEALRAEIKKAEESVESLLAEKADATASLEKATTQNASLSGEVDALKLERDELQQRVESLDKLHDDVASLEDEVAFMIIEKEQVEERLQLTEADLERTIRLQEHLNDTQIGAHDAELTGCEEIINNLSMEKSKVQDELTKISQQLTENTAASEETVAMLQNDLSEHQDQYNSLEAGMKDAQEAVENLLSEKTQTAASLEKVTAQCVTLSEDVQALKSERDALQLTLNTKLSELQKDLDVALGDNESLTKKLKEASDDLEAKKTQLESLDRDKLEALTQLGLSEEKNSTDLDSFKRQEETLRAEIKKAEEVVESILAEKTEATANLEKATTLNASLSEEVDVLKTERDELQQRVESLDKLHDDVSSLEDEVQLVTIEKEQVEERLQLTEADLERTVRLQKEIAAAHITAHDNDLAGRDDIIGSLTGEKSSLQEKLAKVSQQLVVNGTESNEKVDMLQNEIAYIREEFSVMEHKEKELRSELDSTKTHYAKSVAYVATQEAEFKTKISEIEAANEAAMKELGETKALLAESEGTQDELESNRAKVNELEELVQQFTIQNNDLNEKNASLAESVKTGDVAKTELDMTKGERDDLKSSEKALTTKIEALERGKSSEDALIAKIDALEKENATLRDQSCENIPSSSSSSDIPSPWKPSPIKLVEEPSHNTTFGADDTFDEAMFLPNIDELVNINNTLDNQDTGNNTPQTDDSSKSPSKTPFKDRRALFSPLEEQSASKTPAKKTHTPAKRMTRSMRNKARTPLGKSALQNGTPGSHSTRKVRTNWNGSVF